MKKKIQNLTKKILPFVLIGIIASSATMLSYNEAREVKAVAVVDDIAVASTVALILLAYGYLSINCFNDTDGTSALAKTWEDAYEERRFTVLQGGAGSGDDGDNDDNDDDWEDIDGDGKITEVDIPKWVDVVAGFGATGAVVSIMANADKILSPIVSDFIFNKFGCSNTIDSNTEKLEELNTNLNSYVNDNNIDISAYRYVCKRLMISQYSSTKFTYHLETRYVKKGSIRFMPDGNHFYAYFSDSLIIDTYSGVFGNGNTADSSDTKHRYVNGSTSVSNATKKPYLYWNGPTTEDKNVNLGDLAEVRPNIWVTPDLQDSFDNNKQLSLQPAFDPLASYDIPTQQALQGLLSNLSPSAGLSVSEQQKLVSDFINSLKNTTNPNPRPEPEPNPEPNPSEENADLIADLKHIFPFCVPFDLVDCFKLFDAEPVTPRVEFPIHFGIVEKDYTFVIDLEDFNGVAKVCRLMFLIGFIVSLVYATRQLIRG